MIKEIKKVGACIVLLFIGISMASFSTQAEQNRQLPGNYPEKFDLIGVTHRVNRVEGYININAHHYPLAPGARSYTLKSVLNSLSAIKKETIVGIVFDAKKRVVEIYEVPASMYVGS